MSVAGDLQLTLIFGIFIVSLTASTIKMIKN